MTPRNLYGVDNKKYKRLFVLAASFDEAIQKATAHRQAQTVPVIDKEGDLNLPDEDDHTMIRVELLTDNIIL